MNGEKGSGAEMERRVQDYGCRKAFRNRDGEQSSGVGM